MSWDWSFALESIPQIMLGLRLTVLATVLGSMLALAIGLAFALAARSTSGWLRRGARGMSEFIRRTPLLVQLYLIYFALPSLGVSLPALLCGVLALGLHTGAYLSEVYRAGIESVPRGQWEACVALNYGRVQTWLKIILPQAIPPMIPAIGNYVILMFKDSALLSIIAVPEMMSMGRNIGNSSYRYLEPLTIVAVLYLILSLVAAVLVRLVERRSGLARLAA
ncbi:ectoine/hydroxyectoine ABC transporter permease subunit EhuD [Labrys wisconsinensis]|uniref:Polar amino acid transport system permease protein n=1 Tax=Labrys wisconsinensis TaxID=425677 RepID=A0ABU0JAS5_9HYPH|nr:ectoine/hydroxyectoine ABC transporter permease subunit EhuD [Labrys wisconsinensis]MDQ0470641.1 polar amino acid transport system permease protein [Labrys wisconsinensis]